MNKNPLNKGMIQENSTGIGEVSSEMLADRADELALIAGRPVNMKDSEQARRELTGGNSMSPKQEWLDSISDDERGELIPSSTGHRAQESDSETEDEAGQSRSAQLYEEGVSEAGHDQMLEAAKAAQTKDKSGQSSISNDHGSSEYA